MRIVWSRQAVDQLEDIHAWIAADNQVAAARVEADIRRRVENLAATPFAGLPGRAKGTRELIARPFIIVYAVLDDTIPIFAIRHGARRWPDQFVAEV